MSAPRFILTILLAAALLPACSTYKTSGGQADSGRALLNHDADLAISHFKAADPKLARFFDTAVGFVIFPNVGKGGLVLGGAHGTGELREHGAVTGYATLTQATIGAQIGGQAYSEIIFFQDRANLDDFKASHFEWAAQASGVIANTGASADADYHNGVAIFTLPIGGLMGEAAVGAQKFSFEYK